MPAIWPAAACFLVLSFFPASTLPAQEPAPGPDPREIAGSEGTIPVKIVGGRLVAPVELSTIHKRIPANLFIEYETPCGLRLHDNAALALQTEDEIGNTTPVTIHFPDFDITREQREQGPQEEYDLFTRLHSQEINEDALVGTIGAEILSQYRVTFGPIW